MKSTQTALCTGESVLSTAESIQPARREADEGYAVSPRGLEMLRTLDDIFTNLNQAAEEDLRPEAPA